MSGSGPPWYRKLARRARRLKRQLWILSLALRDRDTPWSARIPILLAIAYVTSPIDLIPDFLPLIGQLDDLIIVPILIGIALRNIPKPVVARCRREAWKRRKAGERISRARRPTPS